jgi:hypothetical protein
MMTKKTKAPLPRSNLKKTIQIKDKRVGKTEDELTKIVLDTFKEAGFDWVESVTLERRPLQIPNWRILRTSGHAPDANAPIKVITHPKVVGLGFEFALLPKRK